MNILFISALLPYPLHSGGQVRMFNLLKELSKKHDITLFSFIRSHDEEQYVKELSFCKHVRLFFRGSVANPTYFLKALTSFYPLLISSYDNSEMKKAIADELRKKLYDCIHLEPFYVYPVLPETHIPLVVSEHNIEYQVYEELAKSLPTSLIQHLGAWDVKKMVKAERTIWEKATEITAVSTPDATHIRSIVGNDKVAVVPNGIDPTYFSYTKRPFDKKAPKFLFVGNFSWKPNEEALHILLSKHWSNIKDAFPNVTLTVCGKHVSEGLLHMLKQQQITYIPSVSDIRTLYASHDVLLAPFSYGGGTKFKILEAMASGALVITTKPGIEGIDAIHGKHCLIADDVASFVPLVASAYNDVKKTQEITKQARSLVERVYNWNDIAKTLDAVWKKTV